MPRIFCETCETLLFEGKQPDAHCLVCNSVYDPQLPLFKKEDLPKAKKDEDEVMHHPC